MVTGEVEDVEVYLRQTSVFVAPLRVGSGTRIKILQAMSRGLPVVSTSLGCKGISVENGRHIIIEDDPTAFAQRVIFAAARPGRAFTNSDTTGATWCIEDTRGVLSAHV